jgi:DNA-binding transcriptional ArsR family regulator
MQDLLYIETVDQAMTLLKPRRLELLRSLDQPRTCMELARRFDETAQKIYYHVKTMEKAGLVEKVGERRVRGTVEGSYQAKARSYWLAPNLVGQIGGRRPAQDQISLHMLCSLAEEILDDVGQLANRSAIGQDVPSLSLSGEVALPNGERRTAFLHDVQHAFEALARAYGMTTPDSPDSTAQTFRLMLACYPSD